MSMNQQQILHSLAMGQLTMVAPALGDSYAGKSVGTLGLLTLMLAGQQDRMMQFAMPMRVKLEALLASAAAGDPALQAEVRAALSDACGGSWTARQDRLLGALEAVHAHADSGAAQDPQLAARCRAYLVEWAEAEQMDVPELPV